VSCHFGSGRPGTGEEELADLARLVLEDLSKRKPEETWRLRVPEDAKGLYKRWQDVDGRERVEAVLHAWRTGGDLRGLAFGTHEGRLDLRGLVDPHPDEVDRDVASLEGLDLAGARMGRIHFTKRTIADCRFDGATLADLRLWSSSITDCSFKGAKLNGTLVLDGRTSFGWGPRCHHRRTDFSQANLAGLHVGDAVFEDCDFSGAKLAGAEFECDLVRCRFAGHLHDVAFRGHRGIFGSDVRHEDVDLKDADLHFVGFQGADLAGFRLPDDPRVLVLEEWPRIRAWLEDRFAGEFAPVAVRLAMSDEPRYLPRNGQIVLELATIEEDAGRDAVVELRALLAEASAGRT
jgi:uncharacterized protein YjbI with pentapeptide repeats